MTLYEYKDFIQKMLKNLHHSNIFEVCTLVEFVFKCFGDIIRHLIYFF